MSATAARFTSSTTGNESRRIIGADVRGDRRPRARPCGPRPCPCPGQARVRRLCHHSGAGEHDVHRLNGRGANLRKQRPDACGHHRRRRVRRRGRRGRDARPAGLTNRLTSTRGLAARPSRPRQEPPLPALRYTALSTRSMRVRLRSPFMPCPGWSTTRLSSTAPARGHTKPARGPPPLPGTPDARTLETRRSHRRPSSTGEEPGLAGSKNNVEELFCPHALVHRGGWRTDHRLQHRPQRRAQGNQGRRPAGAVSSLPSAPTGLPAHRSGMCPMTIVTFEGDVKRARREMCEAGLEGLLDPGLQASVCPVQSASQRRHRHSAAP